MRPETREVVFVDGVRTPFGKAGSMYAETRADDLVVACIRELIRRHPELPPERVDEVAIAATTQVGDQGLTIGRTAALLAGLPRSVPGFAIDRMCAGAMTAVTTVASGIAVGAYDVALAGGVEHMSRHPMGQGIDPNPRIVAEKLVDQSALVMGATAENLHDRFPQISRERADAYAVLSQDRVQQAYTDGVIQESLVSVATRSTELGWGLATADEPPRPGTTADALAGLRTPFRPHGRVTAGNAAGLNDGATACLLAAEEVAAELGLPVAMRLVTFAFAGVDPETMGVGPIPATEKALAKAGLKIGDIGAIEINEAFAVQVLAFLDHFGIPAEDPRVNPYGGAIALGHPLASSGVRLMIHLARAFRDHPEVRYGLTTLCIGLGMGGTVIWENPRYEREGGDPLEPPAARRKHMGARRWCRGPSMSPEELDTLIAEASEAAEGEVVTRALSRDVALPHGAGTGVVITLDNGQDHTRPNTLGPAGLGQLKTALDAAQARDDIAAILITGKPFILAAGADLSFFGSLTTREHALAIARIGHAIYDKLHTSAVPTFALINGMALGGGLELTLHCHYRTVSSAAAGIALPECFLGMFPGWGGAYLAAQPDRRRASGDFDHREPAEPEPDARRERGVRPRPGRRDVRRRGLPGALVGLGGRCGRRRGDRRAPGGRSRRGVGRGHGRGPGLRGPQGRRGLPGPYRALELMAAAKTADRTSAYAAEDTALADLIMGDELRASLYAFELVRKRGRKPAGAPDPGLARPVTKVGVVGAGLMASQLATLFLRQLKVPVVITDLDQERVDKGLATISGEIDTLLRKKRVTPDGANRLRALLTGTTELADFADCDFVIEAVFEDMSIKQQVFADLEKHISAECVLATNTSSLSVSEMAVDLAHPERVVGFHFFNPVAVLPLLEVVRGRSTDDATLATALAVAKDLRKNAVLVADAGGFVVNRVLLRLMGEVFATVDEGTPVKVADAALAPLGLPMPPMVLLQLVGPPIVLHVLESLHASFGDRFPVSESLRALVASKRTGIYDWTPEGETYVPDEVQALLHVGDRPSTAEQVRERALAAVTEEIGLMLDEGVVAAPMDIDLCLILGAGWPFHLGGITPYLDRTGISERVLGRRFLPPGVASVAAHPEA